jgi:hypothetical protein
LARHCAAGLGGFAAFSGGGLLLALALFPIGVLVGERGGLLKQLGSPRVRVR